MLEKKLLFQGSVLDIYVILQDDRSEVGEFIDHFGLLPVWLTPA